MDENIDLSICTDAGQLLEKQRDEIMENNTQKEEDKKENDESISIVNGTLDDKQEDISYNSEDSSSQFDVKPSSDICMIPELESKYLEEQANLKKQLEESETKCTQLQKVLLQKDEFIVSQEKGKHLLDKEKKILKREMELAVKEKENAVMRYVTVEKGVLDMKTLKETFERKFKEAQKEMELMNGKIKMMSSEKTRICNMLDAKCHELKNSQKDCEKIKNDLSSLEMKSKWNLLKIKQETDLKIAAEKKIEELNQELNVFKSNETAKIKEETQIEKLSETQLMEQQATLILLKHGNEGKEKRIEILENKISNLQSEFNESTSKLNTVYKERDFLNSEVEKQKLEINELQTTLDREFMRVAEFQTKLNDFESFKTQLSIEKESNLRTRIELETLKTNFDEQEVELEKIRTKECELLQFNKELSERTVKLQNDISLYNSKSLALCLENETIKKDKKYFDDKITELETQLSLEKSQRNDERVLMTKHISEKTKLCETLQKKLESFMGDLDAVKNKHSQAIKEQNRELSQLRKKCQQIENGHEKQLESPKSTEPSSSHTSDTDSQNDKVELPTISIQEPSKKNLIDRIVRLQHASARQNEKIDYLENHSGNLSAELQKKTKLIQYYMLRDQTGALASSKSDHNKAELAKYGGIMAAIYNGIKSTSSSGDMTLELSLEINRKLQAVLEDTLLKNITLKENLDTLGLEIDKLTRSKAHK